jgi:primosomal protein N' (replication factor Y)
VPTAPSAKTQKVPVVDVVFGARTGGAEAEYTYLCPYSVTPGALVLAPLQSRPLVGIVRRRYEASDHELGFPIEKLRPIESVLDSYVLPPALFRAAEFLAEEYLCPFPVAIGPAIPTGISDSLVSSWTLVENQVREGIALTPLQAELIEVARQHGGKLNPAKSIPQQQRKAIRLLEAKGILTRMTTVALEEDRAPLGLLRLVSDDERIDSYLRDHAQKRPAQTLALLRLRESEAGALSMEDIRVLGGTTHLVVKSLVEAGLLEAVDESSATTPISAPTPNEGQLQAIEAISRTVRSRSGKGFLLFGVTGSGKTEVYLRAAAESIRQGRQVLYLVPEIALATQAIGRLRERFGKSVAVLHSELTPRERIATWIRIARGQIPIVIGARSALFAPLSNLGLIVMDEEHEGGYKQESSPRYHAKALVKFLAKEHGCPFVLGSATPSIETFNEALAGEIELLELPERAASAQLPTVEIEDLGAGFRSGSPALLTERLEELLAETVRAGHQAILFLNRRAYAPFLVCRECGHFFMCPNCAVTLTYSRKSIRLRCHHCGHQERPPDVCPSCKGSRLNPIGVGTEKVEEAVQALLPNVKVERLDRDVAQRKGALESILARFGAGEIDVLVGTQIVAKGLNFPNVTLVGVVAADVSLNLPDFRASERTFQLLSQVAGRAGRGTAPGRVVFQTFSPSHIALQTARTHDYRSFYEGTITERQDAKYPPFVKLVNIVISGSDYAPVVQSSEMVARELRGILADAVVLGPAQCVLERLHNRWRWHVLVKLAPDRSTESIRQVVDRLASTHVQIMVDVNPHSLM